MAMTKRGMAGRVRRYGKRRAMRSWPLLLPCIWAAKTSGAPNAPAMLHSLAAALAIRSADAARLDAEAAAAISCVKSIGAGSQSV
jgi:hypothetical protein